MRPLDRLPSIKLKLSIVIVAAVAVTAAVTAIGARLGWPLLVSPLVAGVLALAMVQVLAHGMTSPLRDMAAAARAMERGEVARRVRATSADEVGELARAFNAMAAELAEVDRFRRDLVANVSHELRTPIAALRAELENLVDGVVVADADALAAVLEQVERLGRLVGQLLDLSRLESGGVPLQREVTAMGPLLESAAAEAGAIAGSVGIMVSVTPPDLAVNADPERLRQVLTNLASNAARYAPAGTEVELRARRENGRVRLEVLDHGPGIPDEEAERVFERFYRADTARAATSGGAGLGLAIARWIVDLHGGSIRAERREPTGCRVVVTLP